MKIEILCYENWITLEENHIKKKKKKKKKENVKSYEKVKTEDKIQDSEIKIEKTIFSVLKIDV